MIERDLVFLNVDADQRDAVLDRIIDTAHTLNYLEDTKVFKDGVMERENIIPTSVGFKVAIPHCRSNTVNKPFVSFMRTNQAFRWDERNEEDVDFIFLIGVPETTESNLHLKFLSAISRKLMNEAFRDSLRNAKDVEEAYDILEAINQSIGGQDS